MSEERVYTGVAVRFLHPCERAVPTGEKDTPLVIEPREPGLDSSEQGLYEFLASHSTALLVDVAKHGAVLLRGFGLHSVEQFECAILAIEGYQPFHDALMSEPGRTIVPGTAFALHTNAHFKTGGGLSLCSFHTENYYSPDVPQRIAFFCEQPPWFGGETGLVNTARLYAELSASTRAKLEENAFLASAFSLREIGERYHCSEDAVAAFCGKVGLRVEETAGVKFVPVHKASVVIHPVTQERALALNFVQELGDELADALVRVFSPDYAGARWLLHRLAWRFPRLQLLQHLGGALRAPRVAWRSLFPADERGFTAVGPRIKEAFAETDLSALAASMRRRYSSFTWKPGDVLIVDNLKMAHSGMAGFGPRTLRVIIGGAIRLDTTSNTKGIFLVNEHASREPLGAALRSWVSRGRPN